MNSLQAIKKELQSLADPQIAQHSQRFFKTGKGDYGEGDVFLGIRVPVIRKLAKRFHNLPLDNIESLLKSKFHEQRLLALIMMVNLFKKSDSHTQQQIFNTYINNIEYINNWDLIDTTTPHIVGTYLFDKNRQLLFNYAESENLWQRRISVLACLYFIQRDDFKDFIEIAETLVNDQHDLIHKAVGWMLREAAKKQLSITTRYLDQYAAIMPRTMLRYALKKFPANLKKEYMAMKARQTAAES